MRTMPISTKLESAPEVGQSELHKITLVT